MRRFRVRLAGAGSGTPSGSASASASDTPESLRVSHSSASSTDSRGEMAAVPNLLRLSLDAKLPGPMPHVQVPQADLIPLPVDFNELIKIATDDKSDLDTKEEKNKEERKKLGIKPWDAAAFPVEKVLGQGSFGRAFLSKGYVIKQVSKMTKDGLQRLVREVQVLQHIREDCNEYLLCFLSVYDNDTDYFIQTQWLGPDYISLDQALTNPNFYTNNPLLVAKMIVNLFRGMNLLKKIKVAHRDIKPANIMVNLKDGQIRIIDFGEACVNTCDARGQVGTYAYMAPEIYFYKSHYEFDELHAADLWSLGWTIWQMVLQPELLGRATAIDLWYNADQKEKLDKWMKSVDYNNPADPLAVCNSQIVACHSLAEKRMQELSRIYKQSINLLAQLFTDPPNLSLKSPLSRNPKTRVIPIV
jgi:serine/threonine protein kinase